MTMREKLIEVAEGEIGACEPKGDDKYIKYYNEKTNAGFSLAVPWCAIFVSWCKDKAGIGNDVIPLFASCDAGKNFFEKRGLYEKGHAYGGNYTPKRGDIIFFSSGYTQKDATHVGIVTSVSSNAVSTIEGNTSDCVKRKSYSMLSKYIIGYGCPKYDDCYETYCVQKGDSLWKIAKKLLGSGLEYTKIMELNEMNETKIYAGEVLKIPKK